MRLTPSESAELTIVPGDVPFEIMRGTFRQQRFAPHCHDTYAFGTIERGISSVRFRGRDVVRSAGDVVTIAPGEMHTGGPADPDGWAYRMLYVPEVLVRRANGGAAPVFAASGVNDPDLSARMSAAHAVMEGGASARAKMAALEHVIGVLCERHALRGAARERQLPRTRMVDVRRYLDAHFAERVRLADLAAIAHVGRFHLIRAFRAAYGIPPYAYLELARVTRARAMLRDGVRVSDVAFSTGFSDQSHLTRRFKRVFGVPPGRYARSYARARLDLRSA